MWLARRRDLQEILDILNSSPFPREQASLVALVHRLTGIVSDINEQLGSHGNEE